jgi:O-antigen/teichoic acid export membrane protein
MLVVLTKSCTSSEVGLFGLALSLSAPVLLFLNLQLRAVHVTDADEEYRFGEYLALRILTCFVAPLVLLLIGWIGGYSAEVLLVLACVGTTKIVESLSDVFQGLQQKHGRMDAVAWSQLLRGLLGLVLLALGAMFTHMALFGAIGMLVATVGTFLALDLPFARRFGVSLRPEWRSTRLRALLVVSFPLGLVMMLSSLSTNVPRYILERYEGPDGLGVFAAMAYILVAGSTVVNAVGQSIAPRLAEAFARGRMGEFHRLRFLLLGVGAMVGTAFIAGSHWFGEEVLTLLYTAEYAAHSSVFSLLVVAGAINFLAAFSGFSATATRSFKGQVVPLILTTLATAACARLLIPSYGLMGAAYSEIAGGITNLVLLELLVIRAIRSARRTPADVNPGGAAEGGDAVGVGASVVVEMPLAENIGGGPR